MKDDLREPKKKTDPGSKKPKTKVDFSHGETTDKPIDPTKLPPLPPPTDQKSMCPQCHEMLPDPNGQGVKRHEKCGFCIHPGFKTSKDDKDKLECVECGEPVSVLFCFNCGKELTDREHGNSIVGAQFKSYVDDREHGKISEFQQKQWGVYWEQVKELHGLNICFECYINGLMNLKKHHKKSKGSGSSGGAVIGGAE